MAKNRKHVTLGDISSMLNKHFIKYVKSEKSIKALKSVKENDLIILNNRSDFKMFTVVTNPIANAIPTGNSMYAVQINIHGTDTINNAINDRVKYSDISQTMIDDTNKVPSIALIKNNDKLYAKLSQIVSDFTTGGTNTIASGETIKLLYQMLQNMGEGGAVKLEYYLQRAAKSKLPSYGNITAGTTTIVINKGIIINPMVFINGELLTPEEYDINVATSTITLKTARMYAATYFVLDDYMPQYKFSTPSVNYLLGSNALKAQLMIEDIIDIQGESEAFDGGHHLRKVEATSKLNGVKVKDGMYLNEVPNSRSSGKQDINDATLTTIAKTIVGAINENKADIDFLKARIQFKRMKSTDNLNDLFGVGTDSVTYYAVESYTMVVPDKNYPPTEVAGVLIVEQTFSTYVTQTYKEMNTSPARIWMRTAYFSKVDNACTWGAWSLLSKDDTDRPKVISGADVVVSSKVESFNAVKINKTIHFSFTLRDVVVEPQEVLITFANGVLASPNYQQRIWSAREDILLYIGPATRSIVSGRATQQTVAQYNVFSGTIVSTV